MYFEPKPKTLQKDLFGVDFILATLESYMNDKNIPLIVIKGLRRTGKTSLLNVGLHHTKHYNTKIDVRESPYYDLQEFMMYFIENIKQALGDSLIKRILKHIDGLELSYQDISTKIFFRKEKNMISFIKKIDVYLQKKKKFLIIALDEAQLLTKIKFNYILAAIYDNYKNIKVILSGSEIGLLDKFIGKRDAKSPLFGRSIMEIQTVTLHSQQTAQFLVQGFKQIKKDITHQQIIEVVEELDGIIGWATQYGWLRSKNKSHEKALAAVIEEGSLLAQDELKTFLENRNKSVYIDVLRLILRGNDRWALLKQGFIKDGRKISDRQLALYLNELQDYNFIDKTNQVYSIPDPLLMKAVRNFG